MEKHELQIITKEILELKSQLWNQLVQAVEGKLSTSDVTQERLLWEVFNKIFSILEICENSLITKDSLTIHLVARYTYEMLIIFAYLFFNELERQKRIEDFIKFNQFKSTKKKWTNKTFFQMVDSISSYDSRFKNHESTYRNLSNFAHPTMDSFLLNRRGGESEFLVIFGSFLFNLGVIIEIIKICFEKNLFFTEEDRKKISIENLSEKTSKVMKKVKIHL